MHGRTGIGFVIMREKEKSKSTNEMKLVLSSIFQSVLASKNLVVVFCRRRNLVMELGEIEDNWPWKLHKESS